MKNTVRRPVTPASKQTGVTLIVSLIILAVITLLGLGRMRASNLELRMAASARDRAVAFQRAESALRNIEGNLAVSPYSLQSFDSNCNGTGCFKEDCTGGLCFNGEFDSLGSRKQCKLADAAAVAEQPWKSDALWQQDSGKHLLLQNMATTNGNTTTPPVQYIIEFMCFVPGDDRDVSGSIGGTAVENETDVPLYRITVRASGESGRSNVVLQSVFRASI